MKTSFASCAKKPVKRPASFFCALATALILSACGGGGGGGGGGDGGSSETGNNSDNGGGVWSGNGDNGGSGGGTSKKVTNLSEVFSSTHVSALRKYLDQHAVIVNSDLEILEGTYESFVNRGRTNIMLRDSSGNANNYANILVFENYPFENNFIGSASQAKWAGYVSLPIPYTELSLHDNGLVTWSISEPYYGGFSAENLVLGGKSKNIPNGGLEYSNFGVWLSTISPGQSLTSNGQYYINASAFGVRDKAAVPARDSIFTGTAVAVAFKERGATADVVHLVGTASLNGRLTLSFPGFYTLSTGGYYYYPSSTSDVNLGEFSSTFTSITPNGTNTTGIYLSGNVGSASRNEISGNFYGANSNDASEAVGRFAYTENGKNSSGTASGIIGSFGVKK